MTLIRNLKVKSEKEQTYYWPYSAGGMLPSVITTDGLTYCERVVYR